jgi:hypothetical protein
VLVRSAGIAAIASGVLWAVALPLVATAASADPVGWRYDDFNRLLTAPLLLLVVALAGLRAAQIGRLAKWGSRGAWLALAAAVLLVVGNVVEFWLVLASDAEVFAIAEPRGLDQWVGSTVGWLTFLLGALLLLAGGVLFGVATGRAGVFPNWVGFLIGMTAPLLLIAFTLWAVSPVATVPPALMLGAAWVTVGAVLLRYRYSSGTSTGRAASST